MLVGLLLPLKQTPPLPASSCALHLLIKDPIPSLLPPNNYGGRPTEGLRIRGDWGKPAGISPRLAPCLSGLPSTPPVTLAQLLRLHHWLKGVPAVKALSLVTKRSSKEWKEGSQTLAGGRRGHRCAFPRDFPLPRAAGAPGSAPGQAQSHQVGLGSPQGQLL